METKEDKRIYTLSQEAPAKAVVKMSVPLIFGMFIMVLYNLVDTYFIGLTGDDYQMAAVNLSYPVMMVTVAISNMIGTGASSFIARCLGSGDKEKAAHTLTSAFTLTFINSLIVTVLGMVFLPSLITLLGAKENTFLYTKQYVQVILTGSFFTMGSYTRSDPWMWRHFPSLTGTCSPGGLSPKMAALTSPWNLSTITTAI